MKFLRLAQAALALLALTVAASAQQTSTGPAQGGAPAAVKTKIAIINTANFEDQIAELKSKYQELNRKFEPRVKEVQAEADRINSLETTIKSQRDVLGAAKIAEMTEQLDRMKRSYQRKAEDLQVDGQRERNQVMGPLNEKLTRFLQDYTNRRGITLLIDVANALNSGVVIWYDKRSDVTADFVAEYNKANPAQAAPPAAQPAAQKP